MATKANKSGVDFTIADSLSDALQKIVTLSGGKKSTIIVTGSLYLISDFMKLSAI